MAAGQGFPGGILGPGGSPFPGRGNAQPQTQQRGAANTALPENIIMKVLVRSAVLTPYTDKEISDLYPVSVQGGAGMLALSEAYFYRKATEGLFVFRQLQLYVAGDCAIVMVQIPEWWTEDALKKAKVIDE